ncbi:ankyrin repeat-containing domain protein [Mycena olivaceomarginata]|nr:ankyrin repeat-containing domain protein [Mycena olivaceomarginata]
MEHALAVITITTFVKDLIELGSNIKDSIDRVGENKEELSKLRDEVTGTLDGLTTLTQGFNNAQPSLELLTALEDLKNHLESIHSKCQRASQHSSWFKSWWNRNKIDREIKRLHDLKKDCHEQFALFSTARTEGKVDRIADMTTRIESAAVRLADTTARIESSMAQFTGDIAQIEDSNSRIAQGTAQITGTTARTEGTVVQIANTTVQITATATQIETGTLEVACTTARIEDSTSRIERAANEVEVMASAPAKLERWLGHPPDMKKRQDDTQELQHEGTGTWFSGGYQYQYWKERPGSLWIRGNSGTGKSVLSSTVIQDLFSKKRQDRTAIAYFYFDFRDEKSQRVKFMLQSIVLQLSAQSPEPYSALDRLYNSFRGQTLPTYQSLILILEELLSDFSQTYLVLDALDECNEHNHLVQFITRLRHWTTQSLHLLITSQPREIFMEVFKDALLIVLTPDITHQDIQRFIDSELHSLSHLTRYMCAEEIVTKVVKKSNGMFRLAALLLIELPTEEYNTLGAASLYGCVNTVRVLLEKGAEVNATSGIYGSALQVASYRGDIESVRLLIEHGAEVNAADREYGTALQAVSRGGNVEIFRLLLKNGAEVNAAGGRFGSALQAASFKGNMEIVRLLLENGAEVNAAGGRYGSALQAASSESNVEIVRLLLENGADVDAAGGRYGSALQTASFRSNMDIFRLLIEYGTEIDATSGIYGSALIQVASHWGDIEFVRLLIEHGAEVNAAGGEYGSALQAASLSGNTEIVELLLEHGAEVNAAGGEYGNALQAASLRGNLDIVQLLLENGAEVNAAGGRYDSALQTASASGCVAVVCLLLEKGADVDVFGRSALKAAARLGRLRPNNLWEAEQITRILLENGAHEEGMTDYGSDYGSEEDVDTDNEDMTYGSEEDVDAHNSSSDSWSNAAFVSDNEDAMLNLYSDVSPSSESDD